MAAVRFFEASNSQPELAMTNWLNANFKSAPMTVDQAALAVLLYLGLSWHGKHPQTEAHATASVEDGGRLRVHERRSVEQNDIPLHLCHHDYM